jgi:hypothetical protein
MNEKTTDPIADALSASLAARQTDIGIAPTAAPPEIIFDAGEIAALKRCPEALRWIADYNSYMEASADAMDCASSAKYHENRAAKLNAAADEAQRKLDNGED